MATIMSYSDSDGTRRCDARCHKATQPECECICGGRYHGCARDRGRGPDDVLDAELMLRGLDKDALSAEEKQHISQEVMKMFGQYETVIVHDFSAGGVQDALDFMRAFHEFIQSMADQGTSHEEKTVQRARSRRGKLSGLRGTEYMCPLFPNT